MDIKYYFSGDREARRKFAHVHTKEMEDNWGEEIAQTSDSTVVYDDNYNFHKPRNLTDMSVILAAKGSVEAIFEQAHHRTAVLNFASYKEPGGKFFDGSRAQEECLCAESYLYNVLRRHQYYYDWNKDQHLNRAQYLNRALYSPNVVFFHGDQSMCCDVITCAAPNITPARKYGWNVSEAENLKNLESRIEFVLKVAADNYVDTLILGAFGCGVFGQDAEQVCSLFLKHLQNYHCFSKVVFAVPQDVHGENYNKFKKILDNWRKK